MTAVEMVIEPMKDGWMLSVSRDSRINKYGDLACLNITWLALVRDTHEYSIPVHFFEELGP